MNCKIFSQRFNRELLWMDLPEELNEKTKAVVKVFGVTRHLANAMLFGQQMPAEDVLDKIAEILEVCPRWLSGESEKRKTYNERETLDNA